MGTLRWEWPYFRADALLENPNKRSDSSASSGRSREERLSDSRTGASAFRLVSSEADLLSGLVVEQLGKGLVIGFNSAGFLRLREQVLGILTELVQPEWVVSMVTKDAARLEGLPVQTLIEKGDEEAITQQTVRENGILFHIDPLGGQKTGYYADQRENHLRLCRYTKGQTVLDAYAYGGGREPCTHLGEAKHVVCVDSSPRAGRLIGKNTASTDSTQRWLWPIPFSISGRWSSRTLGSCGSRFVRSRSHLQAGMKVPPGESLAMNALGRGNPGDHCAFPWFANRTSSVCSRRLGAPRARSSRFCMWVARAPTILSWQLALRAAI